MVLAKVLGSVIGAFTVNKPRKALNKYGKWAVVTGSSNGIGAEYAVSLAKKGLDVVLIARNRDDLQKVAERVTAAGRQAKIVCFDFSAAANTTKEAYDKLFSEHLSGLEIGVLVNNVGVSYPGALYFDELETYQPGRTVDLINVNITSVVQMTRIILPQMVERKAGVILNIGSAAGRMPIGNPMYAEYSGTKAFVDYYSRSLHHEYASKGVFVQCQAPYFVATAMSKIRKATLTAPSPKAFAEASLAGLYKGGASTVPFWAHGLQDWVLQSAPEWVLTKYVLGLHKGMRAKFLKKVAEKAKEQ